MPQAQKKRGKKPPAASANGPTTSLSEVLTLSEAAAFLRVPDAEVVRLAQDRILPGHLIGGEWRFLKSAIEDWLKTPPVQGSREAVLSAAGAWKDDPYVEEELKEIYRKRGRPMTEDGE